MADTTYAPKVYRKQGGDEQVIASGGTQTIESGGTVEYEAGSTLTNAATQTNTGTVTNSAAVVNTLTTASTAQTLLGYGTSLIGSTAAGALAYNLNRPGTAGARKTLCIRASTGAVTVISSTVTAQLCKFHRTLTTLTFGANADGIALDLIGETSTSWSIVGYSTAAGTYTCT